MRQGDFDIFCRSSIESVNAAHRCPLCNKNLQQEDIQRDALGNSLLGLIFRLIFFEIIT